jgi:hypothetical protein
VCLLLVSWAFCLIPTSPANDGYLYAISLSLTALRSYSSLAYAIRNVPDGLVSFLAILLRQVVGRPFLAMGQRRGRRGVKRLFFFFRAILNLEGSCKVILLDSRDYVQGIRGRSRGEKGRVRRDFADGEPGWERTVGFWIQYMGGDWFQALWRGNATVAYRGREIDTNER